MSLIRTHQQGVIMRMTITLKIVATLAVSLVLCCAVVLVTAVHYMSQPFQEELEMNIRRIQNMVAATNDATMQRFANMAVLTASRAGFAEAVASKDYARIRPLAVQAMKDAGSDFITITDDTGIVVARGHSTKYKDSVLKQDTVAMALQGKPSACVVAGTEVPFTIRASQPILLDGKLVGTLSIGTSLVAPAYLDWLKRMGGMEVTIFKGDTRVMTTILDAKRQRVIGTKMTTPAVLQHTLQQGDIFVTENNILGVDYKSAYWPVRDLGGNILGMWFVGAPISNLLMQEEKAVHTTLLVTGGILLLMLALAAVAGTLLGAPIKRITAYATQVAAGNNDSALDVHGKDDMGALADALRAMVDKLRAQALWYQGILDCVPFSISVTDMHRRWLFLNKKGLSEMGLSSSAQLIGKPCSSRETSACNTENCGIENLQRGAEETRTQLRGGATHMMRLGYLTNEAGERIGHVEVGMDITEQERLQREAAEAEGKARRDIVARMETIMTALQTAEGELASEIAAAGKDAHAAADSMRDASTAMEQMSSTVHDVARNASDASGSAHGMRVKAEEGDDVVKGVVKEIQVIQDTSRALKQDMTGLDEHARNIGAILTIIRDIADQTNLLALNAAIEAARAGEAGRGFAVVADEVRKLAEKSMTATGDVEKAINSIQKGTRSSAEMVENTVQAIGEATVKAQGAGGVLRNIVELTGEASDRVQAIAAATEEQSAAAEHVAQTVEDTARLASKVSDAMRAATQAANAIREQTRILGQVLHNLRG